MSFNPADSNLKVLVHGANNLRIGDKDAGNSNPFVRVYVTGIPSKQDSKVNRGHIGLFHLLTIPRADLDLKRAIRWRV